MSMVVDKDSVITGGFDMQLISGPHTDFPEEKVYLPLSTLNFSASGAFLAEAYQNKVNLWELNKDNGKRKQLARMTMELRRRITAIALNDKEQLVAVSDLDQVKVFSFRDIVNIKCILQLRCSALSVKFTANSQLVLAHTDGTISIYNKDGKLLKECGSKGQEIRHVAATKRIVAFSNRENEVFVQSLKGSKKTYKATVDSKETVLGVEINDRNKVIVLTSSALFVCLKDGRLKKKVSPKTRDILYGMTLCRRKILLWSTEHILSVKLEKNKEPQWEKVKAKDINGLCVLSKSQLVVAQHNQQRILDALPASFYRHKYRK